MINIPDAAEVRIKKSDKLNTYVEFPLDYDNIEDFIKQVVVKNAEDFEPSDKFGCCSKYQECSKVGYCIHDSKFYSRACWYRKNLESGKNFYKVNGAEL